MNANRIINMVIRMVMNRLIRSGVNAGIDKMSKRGKKPADGQNAPDPQQKQQTAQTQKRMRQSMRVARKIGKF
ncbi:hypothetical protein XM53_01240 [Roseovarius atlanticus]|uniref:Uncharacterized protein n=1 Tax=Roseovarius atlanticus TaxID=1641875 RepID=A0A0T5NZS1_9RHOB|nr:hypothetical protein [Roseovarius atlanticus]KRS14379.1 hypothetical protein XM53_01240 [Roseovarius atlanticus]